MEDFKEIYRRSPLQNFHWDDKRAKLEDIKIPPTSLDIFVLIRKLDKDGNDMLSPNIPWHAAPVKRIADIKDKDMSDLILYVGPVGMLRASHREIDHLKSMHPQYPFHPHEHEQKVPKGTIVELEINM